MCQKIGQARSFSQSTRTRDTRRDCDRTYELLSIVSVEMDVKVVVSQRIICLSDILENYRVSMSPYESPAVLTPRRLEVECATHPGRHGPIPIAQPDDPGPLDPTMPVGLLDRL